MSVECKILDYSVGAYSMENSFFKPVNSMIPVRYTPTYGLRKIKVTFEAVADFPKDAIEALNYYHRFYSDWDELYLDDGFVYHVVIENIDDPKMHSQRIVQQTFNFVGFRYSELVEETTEIEDEAVFNVSTGDLPCDAFLKIEKLNDSQESFNVTINDIVINNITNGAIIDGMRKKVTDLEGNNKFGDTENLVEFPKFKAYEDVLRVSGKCKLTVMYYKIVY